MLSQLTSLITLMINQPSNHYTLVSFKIPVHSFCPYEAEMTAKDEFSLLFSIHREGRWACTIMSNNLKGEKGDRVPDSHIRNQNTMKISQGFQPPVSGPSVQLAFWHTRRSAGEGGKMIACFNSGFRAKAFMPGTTLPSCFRDKGKAIFD